MRLIKSKNGIYIAAGVLLTAPILQLTSVIVKPLNSSTIDTSIINEVELAKVIKNYEVQFSRNDYFGNVTSTPKVVDENGKVKIKFTPNEKESGYAYKKGSIPILISAPHSIKQPNRPGKSEFKAADVYTGSIAKYIAEQTGAHVIYKSAYTGVDDNYMGDGKVNSSKVKTKTPYRDKIEEIIDENDIKLVIDLHGFADSDKKDYGVVFGTNNGKNLLNAQGLLDEIIKVFENNGYVESGTKEAKKVNKHNAYCIDGKYAAAVKNRTIANYVATTLKTPSIQIELSRTNRDPKNSDYLYRSVNTIIDVVNHVAELYI